jgi:putative tricarboxylic transport membrane protein
MRKSPKDQAQTFMEKKIDLSLVFFFALAAAICLESYKLGIGTPMAPRPGFFSLLTGVLMGGVSGAKLTASLWSRRAGNQLEVRIVWKRVLPLSFGFLAYVLLLDVIGFSLPTFFFVFLVLKGLEGKPWWIAASVAGGILLTIHLLFRVLLGVRLPSGLLGL